MSIRGPIGINASRWDREEARNVDDHRRIMKGPLGLIFMCNSRTKLDCFNYKVLGLPLAKKELVERIIPGMFLFLFDIDVRELHGIFEASSQGGMNLEPKAFQGQGSYPAQVRFAVYRECLPLPEQVFKPVIQENYFAWNKFQHELSSDQVSKLMQLFRPVEAPRKRLFVDSAAGSLREASGRRLDLVERVNPVAGGVDLANRLPQYRLPGPGIRLDEGLRRHELLLRADAYPLIADGIDRRPLPQTRVLDGRPDQKDLLTLGRLEEVDQLALKYLQQGNPGGGLTSNPLHRNEAPRSVSSIQQEAILRSQALEVERAKRAAVEHVLLREHAPSLAGASSRQAAHARALAAIPGPLRHAADLRRIR